MTPSEQSQYDRIERERRRREAELLALLLILTTGARRYAASAIRHGLPPVDAITRAVIGNPALDLPGIAKPIARAMVEAHANAMTRVCRTVGVDVPVNPQAEQAIVRHYQQAAKGYAESVNKSLTEAVRESERLGIESGKNVAQRVRDLRGAFDNAGMGPEKSYRLEQMATDAVLDADGNGTVSAIQEPEVKEKITALKHVSKIDTGTTTICRARQGITLPPDAPYWLRNYPMLHHGCRSAVIVLAGDDVTFKGPPNLLPPPDEGFGVAPWVTGLTRGPLAA